MNHFSEHQGDIGNCDKVKHPIYLENHTPFKQRHRRIPPSMIDEVRRHIEDLLTNGVT